jgi:hypothetical protein
MEDMEHTVAKSNPFDLFKVTVRGETSKIRKTRRFVVKDSVYLNGMLKLAMKRLVQRTSEQAALGVLKDDLIFSTDGKTAVTARAIGVHFDKWGCTEFCVNGLMAGNRRISRTGYDLKHKESSTQRSH